MTALKPLENLRARGVSARRYPLNAKCAHPECSEPTADPHHIFPRSQIGNDSWFVLILEDGQPDTETSPEKGGGYRNAIPHVAGVCREHHDAVELHDAWVKLEDDVFVWYDRQSNRDGIASEGNEAEFVKVGSLNPQPGSREGKPKRKKFKGEARKQRTTISVKVPQNDQENGAGIWDDLVEQLRDRYEAPDLPVYNVIVRGLYEALTS